MTKTQIDSGGGYGCVAGSGHGYGYGGYGCGPLDPRTTLTHDGVTYTAETVQRIVEGLRW